MVNIQTVEIFKLSSSLAEYFETQRIKIMSKSECRYCTCRFGLGAKSIVLNLLRFWRENHHAVT